MRRKLITVVDAVHDRKHGAAQQKRHQKDGRTPTDGMGVSQTHEFQIRSSDKEQQGMRIRWIPLEKYYESHETGSDSLVKFFRVSNNLRRQSTRNGPSDLTGWHARHQGA